MVPMIQIDASSSGSVVSLFAGCGGLDLGFHEEKFRTIYAADNDAAAIAVYRKNLGMNAHLRDVTTQQFHSDISALGHADVVLGGFPCQGFSKAGPKNILDQRNRLYLEMRDAIASLRPRIFIAENVDGLGQNFGGTYLRAIVGDFTNIGYRVDYRIVDAVSYGVPQHRRRILFIGVRSDLPDFVWPVATHELPARNGESNIDSSTQSLWDFHDSRERLPALTVRDALSSLPNPGLAADHETTGNWPVKYAHVFAAIGAGQKLCNVRHAPSSVYTWQIPAVFGEITASQKNILEVIGKNRRHRKYGDIPNGNPMAAIDIELLVGLAISDLDLRTLVNLGYLKIVEKKYELKGAMFCSGLFKRPLLDQPSPTVLTNFHNPRYFLHPTEDRPFTLRECARLQGFPDDFLFTAAGIGLVDGYRLVGNAVPPPIGRVLAKAVRKFMKQISAEAYCEA